MCERARPAPRSNPDRACQIIIAAEAEQSHTRQPFCVLSVSCKSLESTMRSTNKPSRESTPRGGDVDRGRAFVALYSSSTTRNCWRPRFVTPRAVQARLLAVLESSAVRLRLAHMCTLHTAHCISRHHDVERSSKLSLRHRKRLEKLLVIDQILSPQRP